MELVQNHSEFLLEAILIFPCEHHFFIWVPNSPFMLKNIWNAPNGAQNSLSKWVIIIFYSLKSSAVPFQTREKLNSDTEAHWMCAPELQLFTETFISVKLSNILNNSTEQSCSRWNPCISWNEFKSRYFFEKSSKSKIWWILC